MPSLKGQGDGQRDKRKKRPSIGEQASLTHACGKQRALVHFIAVKAISLVLAGFSPSVIPAAQTLNCGKQGPAQAAASLLTGFF